MIARKTITLNWKDAKPPTITQWRQRLNQVHTMEKMTAKLQMTLDIFTRRWACMTLYLESILDVDSITERG